METVKDRNSHKLDLFDKVLQQEEMSLQFGFYWENLDQILKQIQSECSEIHEAVEKGDESHIQEEIGDLIQAAICLAIFCKVDPYEALNTAIEKYQRRFDCLVSMVKKDTLENLKGKPMAVLLDYWNRAKMSL